MDPNRLAMLQSMGIVPRTGLLVDCLDGSVQPRSWVCGSSIEITEAEQFVGEDRDKQLFLRLCLLSATDLAAGDITGTSDPYVELHWGSEVFSSPVVDKTLNPTWDYTFEFELRPVGSRSLLLQVWDADFGRKGDFLGQTRLEIPEAATKINSEVLDLDKVPSGWFSRPPPSRLRILWTVVDNLDDQPDLLETATKAGGRSSEPVDLAVCVGILESQHSVDIEDRLSYVRVSLNELPPRVSAFGKPTGTLVQYGPKRKGWMSQFTLPQTTPEDVVHSRLQLEWLTQKATPAELQQARRLQFEPPPESTTVSSLGSALLDDTLVPDVAKLDVVREGVPPSLKEPSGSAVLPKTKHKTKQNAQPLVVEGHFSAGLDQMQETCEDTKACWAARAQLLSNTATTGEMLVYVTVKPIKDPPLYIVNLDVYPPPQVASLALAGKQAKEEKVETVWLRSYADFLPKMDTSWNQTHLHSYCDPYVSVKVDHLPASRRTTSETKVQDNTQREVDFEALGVDVPTRRRRQKIVVSVLDSDCPIPGFASMGASLIGQARVSSITYDSLHWHHMFGGSSEGSRLDISESMIKGVLKGSTYRGSLCTVWSRSRNKPSGWPPYPDVIGTRMRLEIGVDRGLYLASRYRERNVSLLVQVAGCALDVSHDDGSPLDPQKAHTSSSFGSLRAARKLSEISPQNADVLEFPGYVDGNGVLRFHGYQWPAREHSRRKRKAVSKRDCGPYASAGLDLAVALPDATLDVKLGQNAAWVSRVSGILNVLPDVDYAYVYLVPEGEEDSPPQLYGCIRLTYPSGHVEKSTGPTWPPAEALAKSRKYSERQRSVPAADITTLVLPERSWEWIKLTWDESVVPVPESRYPSNFGGALRLSARMVPARETEHLLTMVHQEVQHRRLDLEAITALFPQLSAAGETESSMKARSTSLKDLKKRLDTRYVEAYVPEPITTRKTCSLDTTHQRVGSPGLFCFWDREGEPPPVVFQEGDACLCGNAYFHTDVLQAVNLPSLDETSGVNAFWEILIEDRVISSMNTGPPDDFTDLDELLRPSRFPSFLQRAVVPITLKKGDFPPCVIRLYDLDPPSQSGYCQRELIGTAVDWDVPFLEHRNPTNYSPNEAHEPIWYHLNSPTQLPPPSHSGAPRVLACCGFSFECADFAKLVAGSGCIWHQDNQMVKWPVISMVTRPDLVKARTMSLSFDLTVLGLRGLSAEADSLTLTVSSFWKETAGRVAFALPREELPAPNVIRLAERSEGSVVIEQALLDAMHSLPYMAGMQLDTPVGMVVRSPVFSTPVLPYLQTPALSRPALILPEVSLVLSDNTNQEIARSSLHVSKNWINDEDLDPVSQAQRGLRTLDLGRVPAIGTAPPDLTGLDDISYRVPITTKSAQITWVDMFTDRPGFVLYDEDCFCGRMIRDQDAFYLQGVEDADQDAVLVNPSDCVLGDPNRVGWVFADPELGVDSSDLGPNPEEFASFWKALFHEKTRNEPSAREGSLERALRSWIRPVGHVCRTLAEDGSCLLARYNLLDFEGHRTTSMVNVVSAVDAEVVWRRETNVKNAGDTILVLRGLKDRKYYSMVAPSFDLRFPAVRGLYIVATHTLTLQAFEDIMTRQWFVKLERQLGHAKGKKARSRVRDELERLKHTVHNLEMRRYYHVPGGFNMDTPLLRPRGMVDMQNELGWDEPLNLGAGELVVRLLFFGQQRMMRTETGPLKFPCPFNASTPMVTGEDEQVVCQSKCHVSVVEEEAQTSEDLPEILETVPRRGLIKELVQVHIYVLTGRRLTNVDIFGKSDPYLKLSVGGQEQVSPIVHDNSLDPDFCEVFTFVVSFPGDGRLLLQVMDQGDAVTSDSAIGSLVLDLEDRWFALLNAEPDANDLTPPILLENDQCQFRFLPPPALSPVEVHNLIKVEDPLNETEGPTTGTVRLAVELTPARTMSTTPADLTVSPFAPLTKSTVFEIRLTIWNVKNITVFMDATNTNDLYVETVISITRNGIMTSHTDKTDVHDYAGAEAHFNWRVLVPVVLPVEALEIEFKLFDSDPGQSVQEVYKSEKRCLDPIALFHFLRLKDNSAPLQPYDFFVEFNVPLGDAVFESALRHCCCLPFELCNCPRKCTRAGCRPFCAAVDSDSENDGEPPTLCNCFSGEKGAMMKKRPVRFTMNPARLHATLDFVPQAVASASPVGAGRSDPDPLPAPTGRVAPGMLFSDPIGYLMIVLGRQTCMLICTVMGLVVLLLLLGMVAFVVAQIIIAHKT